VERLFIRLCSARTTSFCIEKYEFAPSDTIPHISTPPTTMAQSVGSYTNPLKKFKLVFLGEQSGVQ
jgi:hypothetical protein